MSNREPNIQGSVTKGFDEVRTLFEHNMRTLREENAQLCVYVGEERVVDLWASTTGDETFDADSLVNVFSSGKSLESIAIATLVAKGLVSYEARVTDYWPEFGQNGKGEVTIADLMRHEAGLAGFNVSIAPDDFHTENIKQNKIGSVIETHTQAFREGENSQREYHAISRGWIVNEVFRRVDPDGRTIGEFYRQEFNEGNAADVIIGVPDSELSRVKKITPLGLGAHMLASTKPAFLGRSVHHNVFQLLKRFPGLIALRTKGTTAKAPPPFVGMENIDFFNNPAIRKGETPSANAHCSARGLARLAAIMAAGGTWKGTEYLSNEAWQALHAEPVNRDMMGMNTTFTQGGVAQFKETDTQSSSMERAVSEGREGFYGWMGLGGSIFQWHPEKKIGFSFVPTSLHVLDLLNERGKGYQKTVMDCLGAI